MQGGKSAGQRRAVGAQPDGAGAPGEQAPQARMMGGYRPGEEMALIKEAKALAVPAAGGGGAAASAGRWAGMLCRLRGIGCEGEAVRALRAALGQPWPLRLNL